MMSVFAFTSSLLLGVSYALDNGLALTPQMGWNSWNHFHCNINEKLIRQTADILVSSGLRDLGYVYLNLDDCWARSRNSTGYIQPDPKDFPSGMKALGDYIHSKGLKFGVYSDAGTETCAHRPGSLGHEDSDARSYASWGVDYLKYDNCNNQGIDVKKRYPVMRDALNKTGRPIFYSMCEWGVEQPWTWAGAVGNSWRTTGDISDNWKSMISNWDHNGLAVDAGPGGWNDPDMLEVGNGGMTTTQYKTHFSLWAMGKAPLLIGSDISKMSSDTKMILMNKDVIAINQDKLGIQASKVKDLGSNGQIYAGGLMGKAHVVGMLNRGTSAMNMTVTWSDLGVNSNMKFNIMDLWSKKMYPGVTNQFGAVVQPYETVMIKLTPA